MSTLVVPIATLEHAFIIKLESTKLHSLKFKTIAVAFHVVIKYIQDEFKTKTPSNHKLRFPVWNFTVSLNFINARLAFSLHELIIHQLL